MRVIGPLALVVLAAGCGPPEAPTCPAPLGPAHLVQGFCDGGPGFCFHESATPF